MRDLTIRKRAFPRRDVHAGGRMSTVTTILFGAVAELAYFLQGAVDGGLPVISARSRRLCRRFQACAPLRRRARHGNVVDREDQGLGEARVLGPCRSV